MPWIHIISPDDAEGPLKREYDAAMKRAGKIWQVLQIQSLNPTVLRDSMRFYGSVMHGKSELSRAKREMLATVVSHINKCHY